MVTIFTNGCYDILHIGHLKLLQYASSLGDRLIVALDSDDRVKASKGPNRPINTLLDRITMMQAIKGVSQVVSFNTDEELETLMQLYDVDILVIGNDYLNKKVIGSNVVKKVIYYEKFPGYSTTQTIKSIADR